jgi:hypothetical protein
MILKNKKKLYILLAAICFTLIGLIAAYFSSDYENSIQGTHNKGMYNMLEQIKRMCSYMGSILFVGFVASIVFSKHKEVEK